ncbi:nischarin isoform X1 [Poecilia latipinna]|uniref:nischarin isoform X1 n=1 Tax=Poecilia latipinna TaxID=48699 RepID=UPI00072EAD42|nr:PREDICTED: nischarin isoform X1 [Poecilia latipinna]
MEPGPFPEAVPARKVTVVGSELVENYTVYIIDVMDGLHRWTVKHRYSDFYELHEKLTMEKKVDRRLLPPKKILGKNSKSLVERRQKELELYLQTLLQQFPQASPTPLAYFLHFHLYEINGITAALAEELFHKGEQLLQAGEVFSLRPLQLYSVSQQLRLATPTCLSGDARTDLGHILDFTCRLRYLKISGSRGPVGTSNIEESSLPFDLSVFKSLLQIEISDCSSQQIQGLPSLRASLATLSLHRSTESMISILVPEASEFPQWEPEGAEPGCPVTALVPVWRHLTTLDMSHNCIGAVDDSVKLIPKVEFLDLSYNHLSSVENLQHLYSLVHVDLSYNRLRSLEAAHTRLGNIKTLSLAGNHLETLSGLSKLYSLVNLDLSHNQLAQLEEIRNIGALPCLEKLNLSSNPMCIIPDYRTKVLAQFGDRAAEVSLDCRATTEKELDTVEVLKAIQKAKEVKDRMSSSDKKISEDSRASAAPPASSSSSSSSSCPSQGLTSREDDPDPPAAPPPVDAAPPPNISDTHLLSAEPAQIKHSALSQPEQPLPPANAASSSAAICCFCSASFSSRLEDRCSTCSATCCPLLPSALFALSLSNKDFITQLSQRLSSILREQKTKRGEEEEEEEERRSDSRDVQSEVQATDVGGRSLSSRDGYFEMGLDDSGEEVVGSAPFPEGEEPGVRPEEPSEEQLEVRVRRVLWCCCVLVGEEVKQRGACLVLTDRLLALLCWSRDSLSANQETDLSSGPDQSPDVEEVLSGLQADLLVPYSQVLLNCPAELQDSCLSFGIKTGQNRWFVFSEAEEVQQTRTELNGLLQDPSDLLAPPLPQLLPPSLLSPWEVEESLAARGGFPTYILCSSSSSPSSSSPASGSTQLPSDLGSEDAGLLSLLFLTPRTLWVLRMDFRQLWMDRAPVPLSSSSSSSSSSWCRLVRLALGSVLLHPDQREMGDGPDRVSCPDPQHRLRRRHSVDLLAEGQRLLLLFPLAQDRSSFLVELSQRRASLEGLKVVALPRPCRPCPGPAGPGCCRTKEPCCCCSDRKSGCSDRKSGCRDRKSGCSSRDSLRLQGDENQPPPHLVPGLSPGLKLLAGLGGQQLFSYFSRYLAQSQAEELRHVCWLSVLLYKAPGSEVTSCLLLSTEAIYFLLDDSVPPLHPHSGTDAPSPEDAETSLCSCLSVRLAELQAVNVGLFDQNFRVVGRSADQVVCCLSRDSYGTSVFLQRLMAALSLQQQQHPPQPDPSDQDFYSQFTGKMQNYELVHSSSVRFIYPSDEEMGDLTFIVSERKTSASEVPPSSCSILLYLLVFQVQMPSQPSASTERSPVLQPRTLVLTGTDVFLLDEDYVSYPLPDFAKEPPSRGRYQLCEARRIRDLDRVLLGYQPYPQALTLVFDDLPGPDLLCHLTMDHFAPAGPEAPPPGGVAGGQGEVQWCIFVPGGDSRERLISLLARQWEALCSRELPVELTG